MTASSPDAIAARLTAVQRQIVLDGPTNFTQADALPEGLFEEDLDWDRGTGDEHFRWSETFLCRQVRDLLERRG